MNTHRSSYDSVSNNPWLDTPHPSDAIESLRAAILRIETIAQTGRAVDKAGAALAEGDRSSPCARPQ
jgi:hypothetical protein